MTEIIDLKTRKAYQEKKGEAQEVKKEKQRTISFLKELIGNLEKENLDPEFCIVMVGCDDARNKICNYDIFHTDNNIREILGLMELVKHYFLDTNNNNV